jgi:iron complex outermembrane receptor protein
MKLFQSGYRNLWSALGVSAIAMLGLPAYAQDAEGEAAEELVMEEIIVTASRREENLQEYAGTIQAFTGDELTSMNVTNDFRTLQYAITGLNISNQEGKIEVYLRGIGSSDSDFASDPAIATHYNGIYLPRPRSIGPMFFDVERVEVHKGPQGTLRGRNAVGGTINIISNKPDFDGFSGWVKAGIGEFDFREAEGVFNFTATDDLAFRLAIHTEERDAYMDNALEKVVSDSGGIGGQSIRLQDALQGNMDAPGAIDTTAVRLSMLWEPGDRFSAFVLADWVDEGGSSTPGAFTGRALSAGYDIDRLPDPYDQYFVNEGYLDNEIKGIATTLTYDFDTWTIEYNGSYREYDFQHRNAAREWQLGMDYPGAEAEAEEVILNQAQGRYGNFTQSEISETIINEFRVYSHNDQRFRWTAGLFRLDEEMDWSSQDFSHGWWGDCDWFQPGTNCGWLNGLSSENRGDGSEVTSTAVYTDGTFDISDRTRLIAGLRWTEDEKTANDANAAYQMVLTDEALEALGLDGPLDIIQGTNGLLLTRAGGRPINTVPLGNSAETRQYFLDGITAWGGLDNLDELIAWNPELFQVIISSDFQQDLDGDGVPDPGSGNITKKYKDDYIDWRLGFEHDLNDYNMMYGTISTGTRSGGINRPLPGNAQGADVTWDPEQLLVYEIGINSIFDLGQFPARANGAIFYYDYDDKVLQGLVSVDCTGDAPNAPPCTVNHVQNQNAAKAKLFGIEFDGDILFNWGLNLRWNVAYLDSEFKSGSVVVDTRRPGWLYGVSDPYEVDLSGNQLPNTSKWNVMLSLSQNFDLNFGSLDWTLGATYRSKFYLSPYNNKGYDADNNPAPLEVMLVNNNDFFTNGGFPAANGNFLSDYVPSTLVWNFNVGLNFGRDEAFRVEGWWSNFTDETFSGKAFINESVNIRFLNPPSMWGLRAIYRW